MNISFLALVRHGESVWNQKGLWTGWQDIELTEKGREEAKNAAKVLKSIRFDAAYTSDLKRAYETLRIIKRELKHEGLETVNHLAYKERHYGIYTGKSKWEIKDKVGEEKFKRIRRDWDTPIPSGETLKDVYERVISHFEANVWPRILKGNNILIVAHGNTHRALIKYLEKISHDDITQVEIATGEVILYHIEETGRIAKKEKLLINKEKGKQ